MYHDIYSSIEKEKGIMCKLDAIKCDLISIELINICLSLKSNLVHSIFDIMM
jgi:hypothetical protein